MLFEIGNIAPAALLITAKINANFAFQPISRFLHQFQCIECGDGGAFIVRRAPAIELIAFDAKRKGLALPAISRRNDIQMRQNAQRLLALSGLRIADISLQIFRLKAHAFGFFQHIAERRIRPGAKRLSRLRRAFEALYGNQAAQICAHLSFYCFYRKLYHNHSLLGSLKRRGSHSFTY